MLADINLSNLNSGMFSDSLDKMGWRHQVVSGFQSNIRRPKMLGRARTVQLETMATDDENITTGLGFIEKLSPGDILVVAGSDEFAYFGELMTRLSVRQGLGGVLINGLTRDSDYTFTTDKLGILFKGLTPVDIKGRGRVKAVDIPVEIGGVTVQPGQWMFADSDAAVFLPDDVLEELEKRVHRSVADEADIIAKINAGASVADILADHKEF